MSIKNQKNACGGTPLSGRPFVWRYTCIRSVLILILLLSSSANSFACFSAKTGLGWDKDKLIDNSDVIVVAQLSDVERSDFLVTLVPVERVRGSIGEIQFSSHSKDHYAANFNNHQDEKFWENGVGRSEFPCCICGPDHTFIKGEYYLLFPNAFGAWKSAEIISNFDEDEWYKYVVNRVSK